MVATLLDWLSSNTSRGKHSANHAVDVQRGAVRAEHSATANHNAIPGRQEKKTMRTLLIVVVAALSCTLATVVMAQEAATPHEVVTKVREAAHNLSKTHDLKQFNQKQSSWVWKDTYVFVFNCETKTSAARPASSEYIGKKISSIRDSKGHRLFPDVDRLCSGARRPSGIWIQYYWPKPGEKKDSRKVSYFKAAKGTPYIVGAGIYDEKQTAAELQKLTEKNKE